MNTIEASVPSAPDGSHYRRMTPQEVLAVFAHERDIEIRNHVPVPNDKIDFDTPVRSWRWSSESDMMLSSEFGRHLNAQFGTDFTSRQWRPVLSMFGRATMRDLCNLIASRAVVPDVRPAFILGRECLPAGAFLAIRDMLAADGADLSELAPSTPTGVCNAKGLWRVVHEIGKLSPESTPPVRCQTTIPDALLLVYCGVLVCITPLLSLAAIATGSILVAAFAVASIAALVRFWWLARRQEFEVPRFVKFSEGTTLRDLSIALIGSARRSR